MSGSPWVESSIAAALKWLTETPPAAQLTRVT